MNVGGSSQAQPRAWLGLGPELGMGTSLGNEGWGARALGWEAGGGTLVGKPGCGVKSSTGGCWGPVMRLWHWAHPSP